MDYNTQLNWVNNRYIMAQKERTRRERAKANAKLAAIMENITLAIMWALGILMLVMCAQ